MNTSINSFSRALCALALCFGFVFASCTEGPLCEGNNTEQEENQDNNDGVQETPEFQVSATLALGEVTKTTASFTGPLNVLPADLSFSKVTVRYSNAEVFNVSSAHAVSTLTFDENQNFALTLTNLKMNTTYSYCVVAEVRSEKFYGEVSTFTTLPHPYEVIHDLNSSSALDLSSSASANCYVVSAEGLYKFKAVKGNSTEVLGTLASASILWETFGTSAVPEYCDLIKAVDYKDEYIVFQTADTFKEGNAVIVAKDNSGQIIWSWHIWLTDQPDGQEYFNNAGTVMDRNLGVHF